MSQFTKISRDVDTVATSLANIGLDGTLSQNVALTQLKQIQEKLAMLALEVGKFSAKAREQDPNKQVYGPQMIQRVFALEERVVQIQQQLTAKFDICANTASKEDEDEDEETTFKAHKRQNCSSEETATVIEDTHEQDLTDSVTSQAKPLSNSFISNVPLPTEGTSNTFLPVQGHQLESWSYYSSSPASTAAPSTLSSIPVQRRSLAAAAAAVGIDAPNANSGLNECPVCLSYYKEKPPRLLPCLHSMCTQCVEDVIYDATANAKVAACISCGEPFDSDGASLQTNLAVIIRDDSISSNNSIMKNNKLASTLTEYISHEECPLHLGSNSWMFCSTCGDVVCGLCEHDRLCGDRMSLAKAHDHLTKFLRSTMSALQQRMPVIKSTISKLSSAITTRTKHLTQDINRTFTSLLQQDANAINTCLINHYNTVTEIEKTFLRQRHEQFLQDFQSQLQGLLRNQPNNDDHGDSDNEDGNQEQQANAPQLAQPFENQPMIQPNQEPVVQPMQINEQPQGLPQNEPVNVQEQQMDTQVILKTEQSNHDEPQNDMNNKLHAMLASLHLPEGFQIPQQLLETFHRKVAIESESYAAFLAAIESSFAPLLSADRLVHLERRREALISTTTSMIQANTKSIQVQQETLETLVELTLSACQQTEATLQIATIAFASASSLAEFSQLRLGFVRFQAMIARRLAHMLSVQPPVDVLETSAGALEAIRFLAPSKENAWCVPIDVLGTITACSEYTSARPSHVFDVDSPMLLAISPDGLIIVVTIREILVLTLSGVQVRSVGLPVDLMINAIAAARNGVTWVADTAQHIVVSVLPDETRDVRIRCTSPKLVNVVYKTEDVIVCHLSDDRLQQVVSSFSSTGARHWLSAHFGSSNLSAMAANMDGSYIIVADETRKRLVVLSGTDGLPIRFICQNMDIRPVSMSIMASGLIVISEETSVLVLLPCGSIMHSWGHRTGASESSTPSAMRWNQRVVIRARMGQRLQLPRKGMNINDPHLLQDIEAVVVTASPSGGFCFADRRGGIVVFK